MRKKLKILGLSLLLGLVAFLGAGLHLHARIESEIQAYVSSWEEDLAKTLLVQKDASLLEKILTHITRMDVKLTRMQLPSHPEIETALAARFLSPEGACAKPIEAPLTLYGLPAGNLSFCQPLENLLLQTLLSGPFLGTLMLILGLLWFFTRENWKIELQRTRLQAKVEMQEELSRVSRQVAHDIRSPLSALQILASLSHDREDPQNLLLQNATARIKTIADDLLERGKLSLSGHSTSAEMKSSLARIEAELRIQFAAQNLKTIWPHEDFEIPLRPEVWERILQNLLKNAFEANAAKENAREIACFVSLRGRDIQIEVKDQGVGMSAEVLRRIGEEGFSSGKERGSGFGVSFVRQQIESVGGNLSFSSVAGKGSVVRLTCPNPRFQNPVPSRANA